jgi:hypothetical protein
MATVYSVDPVKPTGITHPLANLIPRFAPPPSAEALELVNRLPTQAAAGRARPILVAAECAWRNARDEEP